MNHAKNQHATQGFPCIQPQETCEEPGSRYQAWPKCSGAPVLQGFAGYKVGMTHVIMVDDHKSSPTEGKDIMVPVTVIEVPPMKVAAVRAYTRDTNGLRPLTEVWAQDLDGDLARRVNVPKEYMARRRMQLFT